MKFDSDFEDDFASTPTSTPSIPTSSLLTPRVATLMDDKIKRSTSAMRIRVVRTVFGMLVLTIVMTCVGVMLMVLRDNPPDSPIARQSKAPAMVSRYHLPEGDLSYNASDCKGVYANKDYLKIWRCVRDTVQAGPIDPNAPLYMTANLASRYETGFDFDMVSDGFDQDRVWYQGGFGLGPIADHPSWKAFYIAPTSLDTRPIWAGILAKDPSDFGDAFSQFNHKNLSYQRVQADGETYVGVVWVVDDRWSRMDMPDAS